MLSFAKENIKKYQVRQRSELLKVIFYYIAEALTAVVIFVFAYLWFSIVK